MITQTATLTRVTTLTAEAPYPASTPTGLGIAPVCRPDVRSSRSRAVRRVRRLRCARR